VVDPLPRVLFYDFYNRNHHVIVENQILDFTILDGGGFFSVLAVPVTALDDQDLLIVSAMG
jgi:hypothetical protein